MLQFSSFFLALALASLPAVGSWLRALSTLKFAHNRGGKFAATPGQYAAPSLVSVCVKKKNNHIQQKNIPLQLMHLTSPLYNLTAGQQLKQDQMENRQVLLQEKQQPTKTKPSPTGVNLLAQILNPQSPLYDPALGLKMKKELKQEKKTEKQANQPSTTPPPENRLQQKQQPPPSPTVPTPPQKKEKKRIKLKKPSPTGVNIMSQVLDPQSPSYDPALGLKMKKELKEEKKKKKQAEQPPPSPAMNHLQEKQQPQPLPTVPPSPQQKKKKNKKSQTSSSPTGDNILSQVLDPQSPSNDPQLGLKIKQELKQQRGKKTEAKPPPTTPPTICLPKKQQPPLSPTVPPPPEQNKTASTSGNNLVSQVLDPIKLQSARKLKQEKQEELSRVLNPTSPFYDMQLGLRLKQEMKEEKITAKRAKLKVEGGGKQRASRATAVQPRPKVIVK